MFLVVLNLLAAFKSLGTLMAVGLMILPATAARYWVSTITRYLILTLMFALASCWMGLIISFYLPDVPSGPAIVIVAGIIFFLSMTFSSQGFQVGARLNPFPNREQAAHSINSNQTERDKPHEKIV